MKSVGPDDAEQENRRQQDVPQSQLIGEPAADRTDNQHRAGKDREEEALSLCKWAAARAGVIVVVPGLGTLSTIANDIYMIMKIGSVYEEKITEKMAVSLLGSMGTVFAGGKLATLIPFAPLQIPLAVGMTYGLGRVVMEWIKAGKPKDMSAFKKVYDDAVKYAKDNIDLFKNDPEKDKPLGDETKKFDV